MGRGGCIYKRFSGVLAYLSSHFRGENRGFGRIDMYVNPVADIVLIAAIYVALSQALQVFVLDRRGQRAIQKQSAAVSKKLQELMKQGNQANAQEMEQTQKEQAEVMSKMMKRMPKQMIASLILYIPFLEIVRSQYGDFVYTVFFPFSIIWKTLDAFWYFVLLSLLISLVVGQALTWRETHHEKKQTHHVHPPATK